MTMRFRTLEVRWHDGKPISSCDFQPAAFKKVRHGPANQKNYATQSYRLATAGEDNHVRIWLVHPNICPTSLAPLTDNSPAPPRPPRVEYLSTLSRHSAAVNVVRFSPNGELIASAGDDGMIIIWSQSITPQSHSYLDPSDSEYDKEHWKPRTAFRCTTMQVYDLAWSPTGEYIVAGSTDNVARIFTTSDGKCVYELAEHNHYVQGVAWDPLNEYIATQSSDRSMHIYSISDKGGNFEVHAVGKNTRMLHKHSKPSSSSRHRSHSRQRGVGKESSSISDAESIVSDIRGDRDDIWPVASPSNTKDAAPLTPAASALSTPSTTTTNMFPPPVERASSRRSSFSGSNAPGSPSTFSRYGRSPSPMPALPAIRTPPPTWTNVKLYGDESFTNFFRRLTFSPDGGLLLTPAGQFEDPSVTLLSTKSGDENTKSGGQTSVPSAPGSHSPSSCVYIYSRANFARPPVAQLPGHQKPSVAVRYSPILYELRPGVIAPEVSESKVAVLDSGTEGTMNVDMIGSQAPASSLISPRPTPSLQPAYSRSHSQSSSIASPIPLNLSTSPAPISQKRNTSPAPSNPPTPSPAHNSHGSIFSLPYRMIYAVLTMDAVAIYDTQQSSPLCLLTKLHYDEFTDLTWSPDGQCLILSSRDGYCTLVIFDDIIPAYHTQQQALQMQWIGHHHSVPVTVAHNVSATSGSSQSLHVTTNTVTTPSRKRTDPPLTPSTSVDGDREAISSSFSFPPQVDESSEPPKKKRRVALTHVGDLEA